MEKIVLADGSEREVPTADEIAALNAAATAKADLEKKVADLTAAQEAAQNDPVTKNWNALRTANESMKAALKAQGKEIKEDGTIVDISQAPVNAEEIINKATTAATVAAQQVALNSQKNALLSRFDDDTKKVVDHYFGKLTAGEQVTPENIEKFINEAARLAVPDSKSHGFNPINGQPPRMTPQGQRQNFADTDAGKSIANEIFGDNSYAKAK